MKTVEQCQRCGEDAVVAIGQAIAYGDELVWSRSTRCESCGLAQEADDIGFPPDEYRKIILAEGGTWEVVVLNETDRAQVALTAKATLGLSSEAALQFGRAVPGTVWEGTECEAAWFQGHLKRRGVPASTRRLVARKR